MIAYISFHNKKKNSLFLMLLMVIVLKPCM